MVPHQRQHPVDGAVRAVTGRIFLHRQATLHDAPAFAETVCLAIPVHLAFGRNGGEEALRVLQRVYRCGEPGGGQARRHYAGMGRAARVERLRHRAEIGHQAGALRRAQGERLGSPRRVEPAQMGTGGGGRDGAEDPGRVPALAVMVTAFPARQLRPDLVAGDERHHHVAAGRIQRFRLGEDRGDQHGAGVAAQGNVVVVQRMGGDAVDPGRIGGAGGLLAEIQRGRTRRGLQHLLQQPGRLLLPPGEHHADAVDETGPRDRGGLLGHAVGRQVGHELAEV